MCVPQHLKYHTQIHVRSRHGKNKGRKISGIEPLPGEDKVRGRQCSCMLSLPGVGDCLWGRLFILSVSVSQLLVTSNDSRVRLYNLKDHTLSCKYKGCVNTSSQIRATFR